MAKNKFIGDDEEAQAFEVIKGGGKKKPQESEPVEEKPKEDEGDEEEDEEEPEDEEKAEDEFLEFADLMDARDAELAKQRKDEGAPNEEARDRIVKAHS